MVILSCLIDSVPDAHSSTHIGATFPVDTSAEVSNTLCTMLEYQWGNFVANSLATCHLDSKYQRIIRQQHSLEHVCHDHLPDAVTQQVHAGASGEHSSVHPHIKFCLFSPFSHISPPSPTSRSPLCANSVETQHVSMHMWPEVSAAQSLAHFWHVLPHLDPRHSVLGTFCLILARPASSQFLAHPASPQSSTLRLRTSYSTLCLRIPYSTPHLRTLSSALCLRSSISAPRFGISSLVHLPRLRILPLVPHLWWLPSYHFPGHCIICHRSFPHWRGSTVVVWDSSLGIQSCWLRPSLLSLSLSLTMWRPHSLLYQLSSSL